MRRLLLLGGSPLDMAAPPSPSSLCGRVTPTFPALHLTGLRPGGIGPRTGRRTVDGPGTVPVMDLTYPPEAEEFRTEIAGWLKDNLPEGWGEPGLLHDARGAQGLQRGVDGQALRRRLDLRQLAHRVRRQGPEPAAAGRPERGVRPGRRTAARRLLRRHARRPDDPAVGHRGAEAAVHPRHPEGRDRVVPGVQRARRRLGPGQPQDAGRARRRRVGHQRPEGVDDPGALRRLHLPAGPHRPRRAQARRDLLPPRPDEAAGRRGAARSSRSTARPSSTRSSSPTCAAPRTTSSVA